MNPKQNIIAIFIGLVSFFTFYTEVFASGDEDGLYLHESISEDVLEQRINSINTVVDIKITKELKSIIRQYTLRHRKASEVMLGKSPVFFPMFESVFLEEGIPSQLKYLSIVESELIPDAKSNVGATGLWQFMKSTGKMYGLKINNTVDQRKDPNLSTVAAARFLKDLYRQFDNWTLALAAYNCGPGNVRKAIRKAGTKDYWKLEKYLPKETRRYIPKFIAMTYLHQYYQSHNLTPIVASLNYYDVLRLEVDSKVKFEDISKITGMSVAEIYQYNPAYIKKYIPANGTYSISLPYESMFIYLSATENLDKEVSSFDGGYTKVFVTKVKEVPSVIDNKLVTIVELSRLEIKALYTFNEKNQTPAPKVSIMKTGSYKLRKGETLNDIALRFNVSIGELIEWNNITLDNFPNPGGFIHLNLPKE